MIKEEKCRISFTKDLGTFSYFGKNFSAKIKEPIEKMVNIIKGIMK